MYVYPPELQLLVAQIRDLEKRMMEFEDELRCYSCHTTDTKLLNFRAAKHGMFSFSRVPLPFNS